MDSTPAFQDKRVRGPVGFMLVSSSLSLCRQRSGVATASRAEGCRSSGSKSTDSTAAGDGLLRPALSRRWHRCAFSLVHARRLLRVQSHSDSTPACVRVDARTHTHSHTRTESVRASDVCTCSVRHSVSDRDCALATSRECRPNCRHRLLVADLAPINTTHQASCRNSLHNRKPHKQGITIHW